MKMMYGWVILIIILPTMLFAQFLDGGILESEFKEGIDPPIGQWSISKVQDSLTVYTSPLEDIENFQAKMQMIFKNGRLAASIQEMYVSPDEGSKLWDRAFKGAENRYNSVLDRLYDIDGNAYAQMFATRKVEFCILSQGMNIASKTAIITICQYHLQFGGKDVFEIDTGDEQWFLQP